MQDANEKNAAAAENTKIRGLKYLPVPRVVGWNRPAKLA
jgi:hypothetical protein